MRLDAERLQRAVGHEQGAHLLRFGDAGDRCRAGEPDAEVLERPVLLGVGEVHRWGEAEVAGQVRHAGRARRGMPDRDELGARSDRAAG